ncbi:ShlB/FhaC/HecB family hemolysin secretion/activation protein [Propionivibrio sp.]|uniref:ShlB/FhaC/HecB family hemolysin secretion/activation protein n=1 Tax=Propionivibrio sp. TaxID=2212460 RepID=UPI003BF2A668
MNKNRHLFLLGVGIFAPFLAFAQQNEASRIEKRFEKPPEPRSTLQPLIFPIDEKLPPEQAGELRFTLKELTLKGNTAFSSDELAPLYAELVGKEVTLLDIYKVRDAITAKYGNAGFGLSKAVIPEQRIQAEGLVRIDIIEGFIDEVIIEGANEDQQEFLAYAIEKIKAERPLNALTLERYLLLANDRFAIKVTSTMKPSETTPAASTLILKVEPAPKLEGGASLDNRGTESVGPNQISVNLAINGLGGRASQTAINYATTVQLSELQYINLSHTEVVSKEGTNLNLSYTNSVSKPGTVMLRLLDNKSNSETWSLKLAHPFIRTRQENLSTYVKFDQQDTDNKSLNILSTQDRIRALRLGLNYDKADTFEGVNQALLQYSFGIQGLGATLDTNPIKSRADGEADFQKLTVNLSRTQELAYFSPLLSKFSLYAAFMGQYSATGLLSPEECGIGGQQFGRAYDSSEILGDSCLAGSLELRLSPGTEGTPFKYAQFYTFYDGGQTTNHTPLSFFDQKTKSLSSTGLGVRFGMGAYIRKQ